MSNCFTRVFALIVTLLVASTMDAGAFGAAGASVVSLSAGSVARPVKRASPAGVSEYRLDSGGLERRYVMYLPDRSGGQTALPVVFDFHGSGSDPYEEMQVTGMAQAAERHGFLLLMPVAAVDMPEDGYTWNVPPDDRLPDDVRFALEVLDHAARRVRIDRDRVFATGFSGGARLASELACTKPERIAAVGAVGGLRAPADCAGIPVPVVAFHGTADPINPYAGGGADYWDYGVDAAVNGWVERNGCRAHPDAMRLTSSVVQLRYIDCLHRADVVLYRIEDGGHTWPGSAYPFPEERFGRLESGLDATELMLEFFYQRRASSGATMSRTSRE